MKVADNVVVSGSGSIGLSIIQTVKLAGANTLVVFDPLESKRKIALEAGADHAFDPGNKDDVEKARAMLSQANGAQVCFEAAGHPGSVQTCIDLCMPNGQVMLIGNDSRPYQMLTAPLGVQQFDLKFSFTYTREEITMLFNLISNGKMDTSPYTLEKAPLDQAIQKLDELASGKLEVARVLLMPHGEI